QRRDHMRDGEAHGGGSCCRNVSCVDLGGIRSSSRRPCVIAACHDIWEMSQLADVKGRHVVTAPLEMLRRVTRDMAVTPELPVLLNSIASALAEHTGASFVRVFLYQTDDECDVCRARGKVEPAAAPGVKRLHLHGNAGRLQGAFAD